MSERPLLEIQFHPAQIRRGVRTFFLWRRQVWLGGALLACEAILLAGAVMVARPVLSGFVVRREIEQLSASRAQQGERLSGLLAQLDLLEESVGGLAVRIEKVHLAYGLSAESPAGSGGYPRPPRSVPESVYTERIRHASALEASIAEELQVLGSFIAEVRDFEGAHRDRIELTPSVSPLRGEEFVLTSPYGTRRNPFTKALDFHAGLDLAAAVGTPIHAPADGVVAFAGRFPLKSDVRWWRYGNLVVMRHGDLFVTIFGHCDEVRVRTGQRVRQGEVLATVGNTGWSTSPHLHYEVRRVGEGGSGQPIDPRIYILDHSWRDEERLLVAARQAPDPGEYEPLPRAFGRTGR